MPSLLRRYGSWSRLPVEGPRAAVVLPPGTADWRPASTERSGPWLPFGAGRTYGDTCVVPRGVVLDTSRVNRILEFDAARGRVRCEAGAQLGDLLAACVPAGWFLPVCPGTQAVTVGGAIAHDVHGKNQPTAGTFGCHVERLVLARSDGSRFELSADERPELFAATVGGLGLTGLILEATLRLRPVASAAFETRRERLPGLSDWLLGGDAAEYELVWIDSLNGGVPGARAVRLEGAHAGAPDRRERSPSERWRLPAAFPAALFNRGTLRLFNRVYFRSAPRRASRPKRVHYGAFLFPQDRSHPSNRLYGRRGVFAYHALVPSAAVAHGVPALLERVQRRGSASLVTVLKRFGERRSPGLLSFAGAGLSFVAGFPNEGPRTLALLADLDAIVAEVGGKLYPAKDARMPPEMFRRSFPRWEEFARHVDPRFGSSFWQRVSS